MLAFGSETPRQTWGISIRQPMARKPLNTRGFLLADLGREPRFLVDSFFETNLGIASFNFLKKSWNQRPNTLATSGDHWRDSSARRRLQSFPINKLPLVSSSFIDLKKTNRI